MNSVPIVVTVATFTKSDFKDGNTWGQNEDGNRSLQARGCIIDIPASGAPSSFYTGEESNLNGWHAICLCGYDNSIAVTGSKGKGAFRIKNSWKVQNKVTQKIDIPWADKGSAWLSYDYVKQYIGSAMVILTHPTDMFIDMDRLTRSTDAKDREKYYTLPDVRGTDYRTPDDDRAETAFDAMLAAYNATPVALEQKARR